MNALGVIVFWLVIAELFVVLNLYLYRTVVLWRQERKARAAKKQQEEAHASDRDPQ